MTGRMMGRDHATGKRRSYWRDQDTFWSEGAHGERGRLKRAARRYTRHVEAQALRRELTAVVS